MGVDRVGPDDLMQRALDVGPLPMHVGAVLVLGAPVDLGMVRRVLGERIGAVPRMRQRLFRTPLGCGGPIWVDDVAFDIGRHVTAVECPPPGDEAALLDTAVQWYTRDLPADRPLWSATLVTGLADGTPTATGAFPRPRPSRRALAADAWRSRVSALTRTLTALRTLPSRRSCSSAQALLGSCCSRSPWRSSRSVRSGAPRAPCRG